MKTLVASLVIALAIPSVRADTAKPAPTPAKDTKVEAPKDPPKVDAAVEKQKNKPLEMSHS